MKKLFILLALGGMLYSCTKETPITPSVDPTQEEQQDAPVDLTKGSGSENGLRVSFTAEVAPFEEVAGAPDEAGEAKGASAIINPGAANNKFVDLRALADATDASGAPRVYALTYIYDSNVPADRVAFWTPLKISNDGKSLSYDEAIDDKFHGTANQKAIFRRMIQKKMSGCYISILIGLKSVSETNPAIATYINPGAHRIDNWQQGAALPNNFVLIKSEANKLEWRIDKKGKHYEVGIEGDRRIKFRMMGYLMMIRVYNHFPEYVYKREPDGISNGQYHTRPVFDANGKQYRTRRPNLNIAIHLSERLSPVNKLYHEFGADGKFYFEEKRGDDGFRYDYNTETFLPGPTVHPWDGKRYQYLKAQINGSETVASVAPKNPQPAPAKYPQVGETVVALYFPLADDRGKVSVEAVKPARFYTGNTYSQGTGGYKQNKEGYFYHQGYEMTKTNKNMEGKVYYPIFNITYRELGRGTATPMTVANHTADFEFYKKWTSDPARNWQPEP